LRDGIRRLIVGRVKNLPAVAIAVARESRDYNNYASTIRKMAGMIADASTARRINGGGSFRLDDSESTSLTARYLARYKSQATRPKDVRRPRKYSDFADRAIRDNKWITGRSRLAQRSIMVIGDYPPPSPLSSASADRQGDISRRLSRKPRSERACAKGKSA